MPDKSLNRVRELAEIFWKFHNDRLKDPSINEMKPYIQPVLDFIEAELQNLRQQLASEVEGLKLRHNSNIYTTTQFNAREEERKTGNNEAIDNVLAIIEGKK